MTATRITLPSMDGLSVAAHRRLGGGLRYSFQVGSERGVLALEPWLAPDSEGACSFESGCGVMTFSDAGSLLSLFGECPVGLAHNGNDSESWFWALFEHSMSAQLTTLFGFLRPLDEVQSGSFECRISVVLGQSRSVGRLSMSPQTLLNLYDTGRWHAIKAPLPSSFPLSIAVVLGHLQLTFEQLRELRRGDVLLLECPHFTALGVGQLSIGRLQLNVRIDDEDGRWRLNIEAIEEVCVDDVRFTSAEVDADEFGSLLEQNEPLEQLPLALSVRCGALKLSLGELRQLAPGVVLTIAGYAPGSAGLYYGDRPIGQGQLVEVDGNLGLQLSRIIFSQ